jgi:hypothetical protein
MFNPTTVVSRFEGVLEVVFGAEHPVRAAAG